MKTFKAAIATALVYMTSFAIADQPSDTNAADANLAMSTKPNLRGQDAPAFVVPIGAIRSVDDKGNNIVILNSNILISPSDRLQFANTIQKMLSNAPEVDPISSMSTEDLFGLLTRLATNPAARSHAAGILTAAKSGDTGALAGHVVDLLGAAPTTSMDTPVVASTDASADAPASSA